MTIHSFAVDTIQAMLTKAPGNGAALGCLKVTTAQGWFASRPSRTEDVYKLYAESFRGGDHLRRIQEQLHAIISVVLAEVINEVRSICEDSSNPHHLVRCAAL